MKIADGGGIEEEVEEEEDGILQSKYIHLNFAALNGSITVNTNLLQTIRFF